MEHVRLGVFFPHEIAASFYHFRAGDLFYNMLTGTPEAAWLQVVSMCVFSIWPWNWNQTIGTGLK